MADWNSFAVIQFDPPRIIHKGKSGHMMYHLQLSHFHFLSLLRFAIPHFSTPHSSLHFFPLLVHFPQFLILIIPSWGSQLLDQGLNLIPLKSKTIVF